MIYETLHPAAKHGGDRKSDEAKNQTENFSTCSYAADAAAATNEAERTIRNKTRIDKEAWEIIGTGFQNIVQTMKMKAYHSVVRPYQRLFLVKTFSAASLTFTRISQAIFGASGTTRKS